MAHSEYHFLKIIVKAICLIGCSLALAFGPLFLAPAVARAASCQFDLGFAVMDWLIPDQIGDCLENAQYNVTNGDSLQRTTGGLLVWRKADNFTAFTNGRTSWVNGPLGLQSRLNSQRFSWEANADNLPIVPPPVAGDRCHTSGLGLTFVGADQGAGNIVGTFQFTNNLRVPCTLNGYVGVQRLGNQFDSLPTNATRGTGWMSQEPAPPTVTLGPGGTAVFRMHWEDVPVGDETTCPTATSMAITPPNEYVPLVIAVQSTACGGGAIDVGSIRALATIQ